MSEVLTEAPRPTQAKLRLVDCDIHPAMSSPVELSPFLSEKWRRHLAEYGSRTTNPFVGAMPYPRMTPGNGMRRDAWPPNGGPPASDLAFLREQLLDAFDIEYGLLQPLGPGSSVLNLELGAAISTAMNEWQLDKWTQPEPRLKAAICVAQEDASAAVAEIDRRAGDPSFVQIAVPPRTIEPLGRRRYWPIFEAAAHYGLPIGLHSAAHGPHANSGGGWFSFYMEEHYAFSHSLQTVLTSLVFEGVFERFPGLKIALIEGGFGWVPPLVWRMDREWERLRSEVPHVTRPPSEIIREHVWFTTQPIEEPENRRHLTDTLNWIGTDRLLYSSDYPHWDFDDPNYTFKVPLSAQEHQAIFRENAVALYRLT